MVENNTDISIIVPLYNEEMVFEKLINRLTNVINDTKFKCDIILISDGCTDGTNILIEEV